MNIKVTKGERPEYSKRLVSDIRALLWVVTVGGLALAAYCIHKDFEGSLPWVSAMVGLPWTAHGVVCSFYLNFPPGFLKLLALAPSKVMPPLLWSDFAMFR